MLHPEYGVEGPKITPVLELKVKELNRFNKKPPLNRACPPFEDMPELMKFLFSIQKTWAHLFIFEILTASRQEAARGLRWKGLDFEKNSGLFQSRLTNCILKTRINALLSY